MTFVPGLLSRLPRPGPWMDAFSKALAFPMLGAAAWLVWVLTLQAGPDALVRVLAAAIVVGLAAWLAGAAQRQAPGPPPVALAAAATVLAAGAAFAVAVRAMARPPPQRARPAPRRPTSAHEPYSPARLAELRAEGRPVFVNYTAAWCVSCQVNDRVALSTKARRRRP